jgi:Zn-dependent alcohol dehydrogenase
MEIKVAVARQAYQPFSIERASIEAPRPDEVLVQIHGVGLCHTDLIAPSRARWRIFSALCRSICSALQCSLQIRRAPSHC